jgi:hypothetical protein
MKNKCKREEVEYWTCDEDGERLTHGKDNEGDAIGEYLEDLDVCEWSNTLTLFGYVRTKLNAERYAKRALESLLNDVNENDGYGGEIQYNQAVYDAAVKTIEALVATMTNILCEEAYSEEIGVPTWIRENAPEWLKEQDGKILARVLELEKEATP